MRIVIIGGGISGLSLAWFLKAGSKPERPMESLVLEAEDRLGGKIRTEKADGYLPEWGVNGFLDNRPQTLELAKGLGLEPLRSSDASRKRYIYIKGGLKLLPETPKSFISSGVLSPLGKLRIALEPFIPANMDDETLADFATRRLGREAFENLIDPMASGIFAGDPAKMSVESCFPKIKKIEREYGSLIKGMIKLGKEAKKAGKGPVGAGPGGVLSSFEGGMEQLVITIRNALGEERVKLGSRVDGIEKLKTGYRVHINGGQSIEAESVVLACPAYEASRILKGFDKDLSGLAGDIHYPALSVISLGFKKEKIPFRSDAFGFLVPSREGKRILGTLYDSSIFPGRAPEGHLLLRVMAGGARASELAMQSDEKLLSMVMEELGGILGLKADPEFLRIFRHEKAIPQYPLGHFGRLGKMDRITAIHKGLFITGNAFRGIALNDCIDNSFKLAQNIIGKA